MGGVGGGHAVEYIGSFPPFLLLMGDGGAVGIILPPLHPPAHLAFEY